MARPFLLTGLAVLAMLTLPTEALAQRDTNRIGSGGERRSDGPERDNWMTTVEETAEGGHRMGNPEARVKVVAYMSMACPECAEFVQRSAERLFQGSVRRGLVSVEYRPFVGNGFDLAATLVARCAEPGRYFDLAHGLLGSQPRWMGRMQGLSEAQRNELRSLPQLQAMQRIVAWLELDRIAARQGVAAEALRACLADQSRLDRIAAAQAAAQGLGIARAPSFVVDGQLTEAHDWPALDRLLRAAQ